MWFYQDLQFIDPTTFSLSLTALSCLIFPFLGSLIAQALLCLFCILSTPFLLLDLLYLFGKKHLFHPNSWGLLSTCTYTSVKGWWADWPYFKFMTTNFKLDLRAGQHSCYLITIHSDFYSPGGLLHTFFPLCRQPAPPPRPHFQLMALIIISQWNEK